MVNINERNVELLKQGYFLTELPDGTFQLNKTQEKQNEDIINRKMYEADFNRRMDMPGPVPYTNNASWWMMILVMLGVSY